MPIAAGANPAAAPFTVASEADRERAIECMTSAIYYEASSESVDGQRAVAQVILNRVRHPAFPKTICAVVYQGSTHSTGCQFTFTCDGSLERRPSASEWARARAIAEAALNGTSFAPVGLATHYHANYVMPHWAPALVKNATIGAHIFYRWAGSWGQPQAFQQLYRGAEPSGAALKTAAIAAFEDRATKSNRIEPDKGLASSMGSIADFQLQIELARRSLGPQNPKLIALEKLRGEMARKAHRSSSAQLAAVNAELTSARRALGPRHPRIIALERQRALLTGQSRQGS